jgi:TPR repeat protein
MTVQPNLSGASEQNLNYLEHLAKRDRDDKWNLADFSQYFEHLIKGEGWSRSAQASTILDKEVSIIQKEMDTSNPTKQAAAKERLDKIASILHSNQIVKMALKDDEELFFKNWEAVSKLNRDSTDPILSYDVDVLCKNGIEFLWKESLALAFACFKRATEVGDPDASLTNEAFVRLGDLYRTGECIEQSDRKANECYRAAADHGYFWGKLALAHVTENKEEAEPLYREAIARGYPASFLSDDYRAEHGIPHNLEMAVWHCREFLAGNRNFEEQRDVLNFLKYLADPANGFLNNDQAYYALGAVTAESDPRASAEYYGKAAELGNRAASFALQLQAEEELGKTGVANYQLAVLYENGTGVEKDMKQAVKLYRVAMQQGHPDAIARMQRYEEAKKQELQGVMAKIDQEEAEHMQGQQQEARYRRLAIAGQPLSKEAKEAFRSAVNFYEASVRKGHVESIPALLRLTKDDEIHDPQFILSHYAQGIFSQLYHLGLLEGVDPNQYPWIR